MPDLTLRQRRVTSAPHAAAIGALAQEMRVGRVSSLAGRALSPGVTSSPRGARAVTAKASIHETSAVTAAFRALSENAAMGVPRSGFRVQEGRMIAQEESLSVLPAHIEDRKSVV